MSNICTGISQDVFDETRCAVCVKLTSTFEMVECSELRISIYWKLMELREKPKFCENTEGKICSHWNLKEFNYRIKVLRFDWKSRCQTFVTDKHLSWVLGSGFWVMPLGLYWWLNIESKVNLSCWNDFGICHILRLYHTIPIFNWNLWLLRSCHTHSFLNPNPHHPMHWFCQTTFPWLQIDGHS